jgi:spore germination protein GerM
MSVVIRVRAALAAAVVLTFTACGIPADESPRAISSDEQTPAVTEPTTTTTADGQTLRAELYFTIFDGNRDNLVAVSREVPAGGAPTPSPATVLGNLLDGVIPGEQASGDVANPDNIVTKIPADTALASQPVLDERGTLTIDLNPAINSAQSDGARLAYGQLVCTATALDEVRDVQFSVEGERVGAPSGEGDNQMTPLTCEDYANLLEVPPG